MSGPIRAIWKEELSSLEYREVELVYSPEHNSVGKYHAVIGQTGEALRVHNGDLNTGRPPSIKVSLEAREDLIPMAIIFETDSGQEDWYGGYVTTRK